MPVPKLDIQRDELLKPYTTFKIGGAAKFFVSARTPDEYRDALDFARRQALPIFVLGGGSNLLVSDRGFSGLVIHPAQRSLAVMSEDESSSTLRVAAAETWDDAVRFAVEREWWGIENLSHIPGQAGAALVQNIGAYGQQLSDALSSAEVLEIATGEVQNFSPERCGLGYRRSIFNSTEKNRFIILALLLGLSKQTRPNLRYPDVEAYFKERGNSAPSLHEIRQAIITIRDGKFPFPREEKGGNAGSFFKNLQLGEGEFYTLQANIQKNFPHFALERLKDIRRRFTGPGAMKIPTAFLIEICDLKGLRVGNAQVNVTQPLVLLNLGGATAHDVMTLAGQIRRTVCERTGMAISLEPELVGFSAEEVARYLKLGQER
jgi:UDP-N-acetylmuramate dehydrogenase